MFLLYQPNKCSVFHCLTYYWTAFDKAKKLYSAFGCWNLDSEFRIGIDKPEFWCLDGHSIWNWKSTKFQPVFNSTHASTLQFRPSTLWFARNWTGFGIGSDFQSQADLVLDPIQFHHLQFQHPNGALEMFLLVMVKLGWTAFLLVPIIELFS